MTARSTTFSDTTVPRPTTTLHPRDHVMLLPDGRRLGYRTHGPADGPLVLLFHGTPSSRGVWDFIEPAANALGVRAVAPDRPGIGLSDDLPNRGILDWPADMAALADELGAEQFAVAGWSGGASYALACAVELPDRVSSAAIVNGIAPLDRDGALVGLGRTEREALRLTHRAAWLAKPMFALLAEFVRRRPGVARRMIETSLPPRDRAEFEARGTAEESLAYLREAFRQGSRGVVLDYRLFTYPWGFDLEEIRVPVHVFHGEQDRTIPVHHADEFARRIPGATRTVWTGGGHMAVVEHGEELLRALTADEQPHG